MRLLGATAIVATSIAFAACSSAKQATSPMVGDDGGPEFAPPDGGGFGGGDDAPTGTCERTVALDIPTPEAGAPHPFDVIMVADNADGLTYSMSSLASGLKNLVAGVAGQSARFFLLSTTQYGASSKAAVSQTSGKDLVSWSSSVTGAADANPVTAYSQQCTDGTGASIACPTSFTGLDAYAVHGAWTLTMPPPMRTLASTPADVFSICGDYSAALAGVSDFAAAIPDAYPLPLGPNDTVTGVSVVDMSGATRSLAPSDYTVDASGVLRLGAGVVTKSDATLRVTIASASCAPDASSPPAR